MDLDDDWESPDKSGAVVWLRYVSHIHETKLQTDSSSRPFSLGNVRAHCDGECRTKAQLPAFLHRNPPAMSDITSPSEKRKVIRHASFGAFGIREVPRERTLYNCSLLTPVFHAIKLTASQILCMTCSAISLCLSGLSSKTLRVIARVLQLRFYP